LKQAERTIPNYKCDCKCHAPSLEPSDKDWKEKFRIRFWEEYTSNRQSLSWGSLLFFIEETLSTHRSKLIEEIKEKLPKEREVKIVGTSGIESAGNLGFNLALYEVKKILKEEK
ncbi:MAG: hypothetical protein AABX59_03710, partial [Nanoarchaeota archaeon]